LAAASAVASDARSEQRSLLTEKTTIAALLVGNIFSEFGQSLSQISATSTSTDSLQAAAKSLDGEMSGLGVLSGSAGHFELVNSVGQKSPLSADAAVSPSLAQLATRAESANTFVSNVIPVGSNRRLVYAKAVSPTRVLYGVVAFDLTNPDVGAGSGNPFSDLDGALYAGAQTTPDRLVLTDTAHLPLARSAVQQKISVGADQWTIVATAAGPLTTGLVRDAEWGVLIGGLLAALLASSVVEVLARRQTYATKLVEVRTSALQDALERQSELEAQERSARETAEAANRSKSEFLSRMSHELRTPLNAILGFSQLLQLDDLSESQDEAVGQITKGGRHLLALINDVLDISRIETGNLTMSQEPVAVADLLGETAALMAPTARTRDIRLTVEESSSAGLHVLADHQRLKQILLNFVSNAVKYNRVGGQVTLGTESIEGGCLRLYVQDDGPGIPTEKLDRLFIPFDRLGAERTQIEGAGVGLALSRRLAEAMGATIGVQSIFGTGSKFWIDLPLTEGPLERLDQLELGRLDQLGGSDGSGRREILYIEDNLSNIRLVERLLEKRPDVTVLPALHGRLGLTLAIERQPALILLDLHLPDMHGLDVLRQIRSHPTTAATPVIILSADATPSQIRVLMDQGATAYLTKPLDLHQLHHEISAAIDTHTQPVGRQPAHLN
jgi:signal transduction histidine kinase/ActR/RegA family two-component response regulator